MKGMIFAGCSFTWGQGLYYYGDLSNEWYPNDENQYDDKIVTHAQKRYIETLRFPRLVANHFNTFEIVKKHNGGSNKRSLKFIESLFRRHIERIEYVYDEIFIYDEIDYIIFQLTDTFRDNFIFTQDITIFENRPNFEKQIQNYVKTKNGKNYTFKFSFAGQRYQDAPLMYEILNAHVTQNGTDLDMFLLRERRLLVQLIINKMKKYEKFGITPLFLIWQKDDECFIRENEYIKQRHIRLIHENKKYDTIFDLMNQNSHLSIRNDKTLHRVFKDDHPSKKCHQVIADSIISHIEKNENNISNR